MRKESASNVTVSAIVPLDRYRDYAEAAAGTNPGMQTALGWFEDLTAPGFRLVWEAGRAILVAIEGLASEDLVGGIKRRRRWIRENSDAIRARVRAVVGQEAVAFPVGLRVMVPDETEKLRGYLEGLGEYVDLRLLRIHVDAVSKLPERDHAKAGIRSHYKSCAIGTPPRSSYAGPTPHPPPHLHDLWVELHRSAAEALRGNAYIDRYDWRTDPQLNLLRAYALLVAIASSLVLEGSQGAKPKRPSSSGGRSQSPNGRALEEVLALLASYAEGAATGRFSPDERELAKALKATVAFTQKRLGTAQCLPEGAYLGVMWDTPVPPGIESMVDAMGGSVNAAVTRDTEGPGKSRDEEWLADANFGVAAAIHIAQTFNDQKRPGPSRGGDPAYTEAALVRVLAGHRVLLEMLGVSVRSGPADLLALANEISLSKIFESFSTREEQDKNYLLSVRRRSLAVLSDLGRLTPTGKKRGTLLTQAKTQEKIVLSAMEAALRSES